MDGNYGSSLKFSEADNSDKPYKVYFENQLNTSFATYREALDYIESEVGENYAIEFIPDYRRK